MIWSFPPSPSLTNVTSLLHVVKSQLHVANVTHFIVTVIQSNHDQDIFVMIKMQISETLFFFSFFTSKVKSKMTHRAKLLFFSYVEAFNCCALWFKAARIHCQVTLLYCLEPKLCEEAAEAKCHGEQGDRNDQV